MWLYVPNRTLAVSCLASGRKCCYGARATLGHLLVPVQPAPAESGGDRRDDLVRVLDHRSERAADRLHRLQGRRAPRTSAPDVQHGAAWLQRQPQRPGLRAQRDHRRQPAGVDAGGRPHAIPRTGSTPAIRGQSSEITGVSKCEADRIALEIQSGTLPVTFSTESEQIVSATLGKDSLHSRSDRRRRRPGLRAGLPAGLLRLPGPDRRHRADHLRAAPGRHRGGHPGDHDAAGDRRHDPHHRCRRRRQHRHLRADQGGGAGRQDRSAPRSPPATGAASTPSPTPTWSP